MAWSYTGSGNNTTSSSWAVSHPAASAGDLLIFNVGWDDSVTTSGLTAPSGPNGETSVLIEDVRASGSATAVRSKVVYYIATGSWSASTITFTPSASEQWSAVVIKVPAGEFDASTPIGADNYRASTAAGAPSLPSLTAGASDGGGTVVGFLTSDTDNADSSVSGWTSRANTDRGAVGVNLWTRDSAATNNESISAATGWTHPSSREWVSNIYIVRPAVAQLTQAAYRFYEDGAESSSTAIAAQDTNITEDVSGGDQNIQLRVRLQETAGVAGASTDDYQLQYQYNGGTWYDVGDFGLASTLIFEDTFTEASNTTLASHTPDLGTSWTRLINNSSDMAINASTDRLDATLATGSLNDGAFYTADVTYPTADYSAEVLMVNGSTSDDTNTLGVRVVDADNAYYVIFNESFATLFKKVSGTITELNDAVTVPVDGEVVNLEAIGSSIKVYADDVVILSATDSSLTSAGKAGVGIADCFDSRGEDVSDQVLDNFKVYSFAPATPKVTGYNSASLTEGGATTNRLGSGTGSFVAGKIAEDGLVDDTQITASNYAELLYSITINASEVSAADTLDFRVLRNDSTSGVTYTVTPRVTISSGGDDHTIVTADIALGLSVDTTTITQNHVITTQDIALASRLDTTTINQNHIIAPQDIALGLGVDTTTVEQTHTISPADITLGLSLDNTTLSQNHVISPADVSLATSLDNTTLTQNHIISSADIALGTSLDGTTVSESSTIISPDDITLGLSLDTTSISQNHIIAVQDITLASSLDDTTLNQNHVISADDISLGTSLDTTTVTEGGTASIVLEQTKLGTWVTGGPTSSTIQPDNNITTGNLLILVAGLDGAARSVSSVTDTAGNTWTLVESVASPNAPTSSYVSLWYTVVSAGGGTRPTITANLSAGNNHGLILREYSGLTATPVDVTENAAANSTVSSFTSDTTSTPSQADSLVVGAAMVRSTSSSYTASSGGSFTNTAEVGLNYVKVLAQDKIITAASGQASSFTTSDNVGTYSTVVAVFSAELTVADDHTVAPDDISLGLSLDATTISQNHVVAAQDISLGLGLDNATLNQNHILVPQDITLATSLDNASLSQIHIVAPNDISLGLSIDTTIVTEPGAGTTRRYGLTTLGMG
jgi:hypothetical protein